jgi:hypothetical protein
MTVTSTPGDPHINVSNRHTFRLAHLVPLFAIKTHVAYGNGLDVSSIPTFFIKTVAVINMLEQQSG